MNKKEKNIELKIYELLGIKTFRKILFKFVNILMIPTTLGMTKKERHKFMHSTPINYAMKKGNGIQDLRDYKKTLLLNIGVHIFSMIRSIPFFLEIIRSTASLSTTITMLFFTPANIYCIMLQRYTQIRINQVIKKDELREEIKKSKLKEKLIQEDSLLSQHIYKDVIKSDKEKDTTFEQLLETATYEQLKQYHDYLSDFKAMNQMMEEQPNYYTPDEQSSISVPLQTTKKILNLELKPRKQDESPN